MKDSQEGGMAMLHPNLESKLNKLTVIKLELCPPELSGCPLTPNAGGFTNGVKVNPEGLKAVDK